jgi:CRISPR/Cas system-associated endoribonuclease Cas2
MKVGITIKDEKTVQPTTVLTIYGIEVDSSCLECRLPQDKITKIKNGLNHVMKRKKIKLRYLQSLIGLLNFSCLVV